MLSLSRCVRSGIAAFAAILVFSCRSVGPGEPMAPLTAPTADVAIQQLEQRAASFDGARSLMRVRSLMKGETQSFRAQLSIESRDTVQLDAYTPVGTTAVTIRAVGDEVTYQNHLNGVTVKGSTQQLAGSLAIYSSTLNLAEMGMLLIGLPPRPDLQYEVTPTGLRKATLADAVVTFDPPVFPAKHVVVERGNDRVEIDHLEMVAAK